jgi:SAM-dependent methyltransferase
MAKMEWIKTAFSAGYDSGDVLAEIPTGNRLKDEVKIGGSYREVFRKAIFPFLRRDSRVLEIGPGKGSWTRAMLAFLPEGSVTAVDFVDVTQWLDPSQYHGRLILHQVEDFDLECVPDDHFDFIWSFGVLCHHTVEQIGRVFSATLRKIKSGGVAVHDYGDWNKIYRSGRIGRFERLFDLPDEEVWWPYNTKEATAATARQAGWEVIFDDLNLCERDGLIVLKRW